MKKTKVAILFTLMLALLPSTVICAEGGESYTPQNSTWKNPATEWLSKAKVGAFTHFLRDKSNADIINQFYQETELPICVTAIPDAASFYY